MSKDLFFWLTQSRAAGKFVGLLEQVTPEPPNLLRVLTYHRVAEAEAQPGLYPRIAVTPQSFDQQMRYLQANYQVISIREVLEVVTSANGCVLPPRSVLITFDDAYNDFAEHAWPILQHYNLPVTLFVPTAFPDQPERVFWWDWLYSAVTFTPHRDALETPLGRLSLATAPQRARAFSRLRNYVKGLPHDQAMKWVERVCNQLGVLPSPSSVLGWATLRRLAQEGVTLGAHTRTHPLLNRISPVEVQAEVVGSRCDLERETGAAWPIFAYPSGAYDDGVVNRLAQAGFALAFTTSPGLNTLPAADRLRLRRIGVNRRTTLATLRARLLPWSQNLKVTV